MAVEPGLTTFELLTIIGSVATGTLGVTLTVIGGFNYLRKELWRGIAKLEKWQRVHDRKDDKRFTVIDQNLFEMKLRNSFRDGTPRPKHTPINDIVAEEVNGDEETD